MVGVPKIAAKAAPEPKLPLAFEAQLTIDDWAAASLVASRPILGTNRRRLLTIFLPSLWFFSILGGFAGWRPARSRLTLSQFGEFLTVFVGDIPFYMLLVASAGIVLWWLVHPWRMRRAMKTALRAADFEGPIPVRYVIAPQGLATAEPLRESFTPWSHIYRLEESRDHIFLVLPTQEETIALPKRALPADQLEVLRGWLERQVGAPQELPPPPDPPEGALTFETMIESGDRGAHVAWYQELPKLRRARLIGILRNWLLASLVVPVFAILAWAFDPERLPVALALPIFWALFPSLFWKPAAVFGALAALRIAFDRPLMRWFAKHTGEVLHQNAVHRPVRFTVGESGIVTEEAGGSTRVQWAGVSELVRLPGHWLARISRGSTLIVPRRDLDPEQAVRFEALCSRHIRQA